MGFGEGCACLRRRDDGEFDNDCLGSTRWDGMGAMGLGVAKGFVCVT